MMVKVLLMTTAMGRVVNKLSNKNEVKMNTTQSPADPCKMIQITQNFSVGKSPYVPVLIGFCFGSCFSIDVPSDHSFINALCTSCQPTAMVYKTAVFNKGTSNETTMGFPSATGCECKKCKKIHFFM